MTAELAKDNDHLLNLLATATTALRDIHMGHPPREVIAPSGEMGMEALLRELVTELRGRGIDDEGGWDCDATEGIPVAGEEAPPGFR